MNQPRLLPSLENMDDLEPKIEEQTPNYLHWSLLLVIVGLALVLTVPILEKILPHPDEYQFYFNAWSIMGGKQLQNFFHVALTEYLLSIFFLFLNIFTPSGVNFPQGNPSDVTTYYGRIFGLILYLLNFLVCLFLLQKGAKKIRPASVIFAVLYFGSLGIFERYLRVNSDSMAVFVALNYLFLSLHLHKKKSSTLRFFLFDSLFVFLSSFTNFKALYIIFPIAFINTVVPYFWYENRKPEEKIRLPRPYRFVFHVIFLVVLGVVLWAIFIPRPISDPKMFWYSIKNATVRATGFGFEYPSQSDKSWVFYLYDFLVEYLGLGALLATLLFAFVALRKNFKAKVSRLPGALVSRLNWLQLRQGNFYPLTEGLILLSFLSYYLGVSRTLVHWSRWGVPLGVFGFLLLSSFLEKIWLAWRREDPWKLRQTLVFLFFLFLMSWSLRLALFLDINKSDYPWIKASFPLTYEAIGKFLKDKGLNEKTEIGKAAWFTGSPRIPSLSLEQLVDPDYNKVKYLFWPYWNIGALYDLEKPVDKLNHNQRALVRKYAEKITYGLPTLLSYYMHYTKYFAWHYLGLTWNPEIDSLVEAQYGIVQLKDLPRSLSVDYSVPFKDLLNTYSPYSKIFNLRNLPDTYIFQPCYSHPGVNYVTSGLPVEAPPGLNGGRTAGLWCHSLWFRVFLRGNYTIKVEGLPEDKDGSQKFYTTQAFKWDPKTKTANINFKDTMISVEVGVATKEKDIPKLKFLVSYDLDPK